MEKKWDTVTPADLKKTLCKWDIYIPLVTKGLSEKFLRFPQSLKIIAGVGDSSSAANTSLHILFNSSSFTYLTVRHWTAINLQTPSINAASIECHLASAVCVLIRHNDLSYTAEDVCRNLRLFLWSTTKCDLTISLYHQYCLNKMLKLERLPDSGDDLSNVASNAACQPM